MLLGLLYHLNSTLPRSGDSYAAATPGRSRSLRVRSPSPGEASAVAGEDVCESPFGSLLSVLESVRRRSAPYGWASHLGGRSSLVPRQPLSAVELKAGSECVADFGRIVAWASVGHRAENAGAIGRDLPEQQPGNGGRLRGAAG